MGDVMDKYSIDYYQILDSELYRLREKDTGIYWYPLRDFFKKALFRKANITSYRDNEFYNKYMRVISSEHPNQAVKGLQIKTWFINEEGLYLILSNLKPLNDTIRKNQIREKYEAAAKSLLGVTTLNSSTPPKFIGFQPDLSNYDVWSIICLTNDKSITQKTLWKRCEICGFYYPNTIKYFSRLSQKHLNDKCRQCFGTGFRCPNARYQYIYQRNGYDLIYKLYQNNPPEEIVEELKKWLG